MDEASLRGKFFREEPAPTTTVQRTQFENGQVRVTRAVVAPGDTLNVVAAAGYPSLLVALTPTEFMLGPLEGAQDTRRLQPGETGWVEAGSAVAIGPVSTTAAEVLRFEFKTRPMERP